MSTTYKVAGMSCAGCARSVERAILDAAPKAAVTVDLAGGLVTVDGAAEAVVAKAVGDAGFDFQGH